MFYNGLSQPMKISIDVAARCALMRKPINKAKQLLEGMALNNYCEDPNLLKLLYEI